MADWKNTTLLIVSPHPDDEVIGCGGFIYKVKEAGGRVYVLHLTVGETKDFSKRGISTAAERQQEIERVVKFMRIDGYRIAFPGNEYHLKLDALPQKKIIDEIERGETISIEAIRPSVLLIPSAHDYNQDHRAANRAGITATRPVLSRYKYLVPTVLEYEFPYFSWSSDAQQPSPTIFMSLDAKALAAKLKALSLYKSQLKAKGAPLSIYGVETLARMRGIHSGTEAAEAYVLRRSFL